MLNGRKVFLGHNETEITTLRHYFSAPDNVANLQELAKLIPL